MNVFVNLGSLTINIEKKMIIFNIIMVKINGEYNF